MQIARCPTDGEASRVLYISKGLSKYRSRNLDFGGDTGARKRKIPNWIAIRAGRVGVWRRCTWYSACAPHLAQSSAGKRHQSNQLEICATGVLFPTASSGAGGAQDTVNGSPSTKTPRQVNSTCKESAPALVTTFRYGFHANVSRSEPGKGILIPLFSFFQGWAGFALAEAHAHWSWA